MSTQDWKIVATLEDKTAPELQNLMRKFQKVTEALEQDRLEEKRLLETQYQQQKSLAENASSADAAAFQRSLNSKKGASTKWYREQIQQVQEFVSQVTAQYSELIRTQNTALQQAALENTLERRTFREPVLMGGQISYRRQDWEAEASASIARDKQRLAALATIQREENKLTQLRLRNEAMIAKAEEDRAKQAERLRKLAAQAEETEARKREREIARKQRLEEKARQETMREEKAKARAQEAEEKKRLQAIETEAAARRRLARQQLQALQDLASAGRSLAEQRAREVEQEGAGATGGSQNTVFGAFGQAFRTTAIFYGAFELLNALTSLPGAMIAASDQWKKFENQVNTSTKGLADSGVVMQKLIEIGAQSRTSVQSVTETYVGLSRAIDLLGGSQQDILDVTKGLSQLGQISGVDPAKVRTGMTQLVQGLTEGTFRAEEYKSIIENIPDLERRIRKELEEQLPALKNNSETVHSLLKDGLLPSQAVWEAIRNVVVDVGEEFKGIEVTAESTYTVLNDQWTKLLANVAEFTKMAPAVISVAESMTKGFQAFNNFFSQSLDAQIARTAAELKELKDLQQDKGSLAWVADAVSNGTGTLDARIDRLQDLLATFYKLRGQQDLELKVKVSKDSLSKAETAFSDLYNKIFSSTFEPRMYKGRGETAEGLALQVLADNKEKLNALNEDQRKEMENAIRVWAQETVQIEENTKALQKSGKEGEKAYNRKAEFVESLMAEIALLERYGERAKTYGEIINAGFDLDTPEGQQLQKAMDRKTQLEDALEIEKEFKAWIDQETQATQNSTTALGKYAERLEEINRWQDELISSGKWSSENEQVILTKREQAWKDYQKSLSITSEEIGELWADLTQEIGKSLSDMIVKGESDFEDFTSNILQMFTNLFVKIALMKPMEEMIGNAVEGEGFTSLLSSVGKLLGFASGGHVSGQSPVLVGEMGPEIFVPSSSGQIISNASMLGMGSSSSSGGGVVVNVVDQRSSSSSAPVDVSTSTSTDGRKLIQVLVRDTIRTGFEQGNFDKVFKDTYGLSRVGKRS